MLYTPGDCDPNSKSALFRLDVILQAYLATVTFPALQKNVTQNVEENPAWWML